MNFGKSAYKAQAAFKPQKGEGAVRMLVVLVIVLAILALGYLFLLSNDADVGLNESESPVTDIAAPPRPLNLQQLEPIVAAPPVPESAPVVPPISVESEPVKPVVTLPAPYSQAPLVDLNESDQSTKDALKDLMSSEQFALVDWLVDEEILRKFVVMVDNMAAGQIPRKHSLFKPMKISFRAVEKEEIFLDGYNYSRYKPYVQAATLVDPDRWVSLYRYFYPLLQQAYGELGYPRQSFHDRMLGAVDQILSAPVIEGPIPLVQPSVMYKFSDPELENLNDVHKQMLRMGPENTLLLQQYLRNVRLTLEQLGHPK